MSEPVEYTPCCTDKGQHGRVTWPKLIREGNKIHEDLMRRAKAPWSAGSAVVAEGDRSALPDQHLVRAESARVPHLTEERWRWRCPSCGRDRPLSGVHLRAWMDATDGALLDISHLPRS